MKKRTLATAVTVGVSLFVSSFWQSSARPEKKDTKVITGEVTTVKHMENTVLIDTSTRQLSNKKPTLQVIGLLPDIIPIEGDRLILGLDPKTLKEKKGMRVVSIKIEPTHQN